MMKRSLLKSIIIGLLLIVLIPQQTEVTMGQDAARYELLAGINAVRIANGLPPFALNGLLNQAAQGHSDYQRDTGNISHDGANGSRPLDRVLATGYPATRANENIYAGWATSPQDALSWWLSSPVHTDNLLHPLLREIGIGIAYSQLDEMVYYTLNFSAQQSVIPIFINNDAAVTGSANVTLTLWNEGLFNGGTSQVMISNTSDFSNARTISWAQYVGWTLDTSGGAGQKTVYIRFLNVGGINIDSQDSIQYTSDGGGNSDPPPTSIPTALPSSIPTLAEPTVIFQPTLVPTDSVIPTLLNEVTPITAVPTDSPLLPTAIDFPSSLPTVTNEIPQTTEPELPSEPIATVNLPISLLRVVFTSTLMMGLGSMMIGLVSIFISRRSQSTNQEEEETKDDGQD